MRAGGGPPRGGGPVPRGGGGGAPPLCVRGGGAGGGGRRARGGVGLLTGMFAQMTPGEQAAIRQVNAMIQNGLAARSEADVPPSLQAIDGFTARARGRYTLSPSVDVSQDQSIAGSSAVETVTVDVLFEEGLHFECMVGATLARPLWDRKS